MTNIIYNADNALYSYPSCLRKNIEELCLRSQIGLSSVSLQDITTLSNKYSDEEAVLNNFHFIIKIPYAGKKLRWEVIFDPEDFYFAPDFEFNDDQFLNISDITNDIPTLAEWNLKDPKALSQVLNEFLAIYKNIQVEKLLGENIYSRYCEEYQKLVTSDYGVAARDVEVSIDATSIHFLISLKVDCSSLPEYMQPVLFSETHHSTWYNPGEDYAHLKVSILKLDGTRSNVTLQLSPRLEQVLGQSKVLVLPDYKKEVQLVEYVALVLKIIHNRVGTVADHFKMKKIYIMSLAAACNRCIVEYNTQTFNKAVFIYNANDYSCLVTVTIGVKFPQEKPSVQLSSIYCQEGKTCNEYLDRYPYSAAQRPDNNIDKLLEFLSEAVLNFKNHKH